MRWLPGISNPLAWLMETGMAWFWPDKRMARWSEVTGTGMEPVHTLQANKTGVLLIGVHFLTLEIGARMFGMQHPVLVFIALTITR